MKKQAKKQTGTNVAAVACNVCRSHKVKAVIALVGLFVCGLAVGWAWRDGMLCDTKSSDENAVVMVVPGVSLQNQDPICKVIEYSLAQYIRSDDQSHEAFINNAEVYAIMAQQGCPENAEKFKVMAQRELAVATALSEYMNIEDRQAADVIRTYKKLNMQREAQEFLIKLQKLKDPAIDFILNMERIINE